MELGHLQGQSEYTYAAVRSSIEHGNIYRGQSEYKYEVAVLYFAQTITEAYEAGGLIRVAVPCRYGNNSKSGGMEQGRRGFHKGWGAPLTFSHTVSKTSWKIIWDRSFPRSVSK
jgi:hypothetical protein